MNVPVKEYSVVDLGCGDEKHDGAPGVDIVETPDVDVIADLEQYPWPLPDDAFETVYCIDILEHVSEPLRFLEECYRIAAPGGIVHIKTPHFTNNNAWVDPTHKRPFSIFTFRDYITVDGKYSYYSDAAFHVRESRIHFVPARKMPWNLIGQWIANRYPWWYEKTVLCSLFPARSMLIELKTVK